MSRVTRIERISLPDPTGPVKIHTNDGQLIGTLTFEKGTSRLTYATGQQPHRRWPLKRKHRR
jgi:hypothetical protein